MSTSTQYHVIQPGGNYGSAEWKLKLEYGCPTLEDIQAALGFAPDTLLEHVSVLWQGKPAHMFVDESGAIKKLPINGRATRIYWNNTLYRQHRTGLVYNDLSADYKIPRVEALTIESLGLMDSRICGPAFLWEGEME